MNQLLVRRYLQLNTYPLTVATYCYAAGYTSLNARPGVPFTFYAEPLYLLAGAALTLLLINPKPRWTRLTAIIMPVLAAGARLLDFVAAEPVRWNGIVGSLFFVFVFTFVSPRMMPPPLRNGERQRWLLRGEG